MRSKTTRLAALVGTVALLPTAGAEEFHLLTSSQYSRLWPSVARVVSPTPATCCDNNFYDGDRLMGTSPLGPVIPFAGNPTPPPMFDPNEFGSLSFTFRRGSVPAFNVQVPLMGIDFLGGPLLDLDGDTGNGSRSLIPVTGQSPVTIPGTTSFIDLTFDTAGGTVTLNNFDSTGNNEGSPQISSEVATTLTMIAGMQPDGTQTGVAINPSIDTRSGTVSAYTGTGGTLSGVYRIEDLGFEFWQDTVLKNSSTANELGTFQFLGTFGGWLIERDPQTGQFPTLTGEGLGGTLWPLVDASQIGNVFVTANGLAGGSATILDGFPLDDYTAANNGGLALTDLGGDLGAYLDTVVVPLVEPLADSFIYLESAGFGINNSQDPIYLDTVGYDVVIIAQDAPVPDADVNNDGNVDLFDFAGEQNCFTGPGPASLTMPCLVFDFEQDDDVDLTDHADFETRLTGPNP